jgi:hypothetical protein
MDILQLPLQSPFIEFDMLHNITSLTLREVEGASTVLKTWYFRPTDERNISEELRLALATGKAIMGRNGVVTNLSSFIPEQLQGYIQGIRKLKLTILDTSHAVLVVDQIYLSTITPNVLISLMLQEGLTILQDNTKIVGFEISEQVIRSSFGSYEMLLRDFCQKSQFKIPTTDSLTLSVDKPARKLVELRNSKLNPSVVEEGVKREKYRLEQQNWKVA